MKRFSPRWFKLCGKLISVEYIVYPPNYNPGDGYSKHRTISRATRKANALGKGSGISKNTWRLDKHGCKTYQTEKTWEII